MFIAMSALFVASADAGDRGSVSPESVVVPDRRGGPALTFEDVLPSWEDFESGFVTGPLAGQLGWLGFNYEANMFLVAQTPLAGGFSARHVSDGSDRWGFEMESPPFWPEFGILSVAVRLGDGASRYQLISLDGFNGNRINTRIDFDATGAIRFGVPNADQTEFDYQQTDFTWQPGVAQRITVEVRLDGTVRVFVGAQLAGETTSMSSILNPAGFAGQSRLMTWCDNASIGALDGSGATLTLDDIRHGPTGDCDDSGVPDLLEIDLGLLVDDNDDLVPDACEPGQCRGDVAFPGGVIDVDDLIAVLNDWACTGASCTGDANGDGTVDADDVLDLVNRWGPCPPMTGTEDAPQVLPDGSASA